MSLRGLVVAAILAVGCGGGEEGGGDPDAGVILDARPQDDAGEPVESGLHLQFEAIPEPEAELGGPFASTLGEVEIRLRDLRVIGDAAPGDDRTRESTFDLRWPDREPELWFDEAPPGVYSAVLATVERYRIEGTAEVDGARPFRIVDEDAALTISLDLDAVSLEAGDAAEIELTVQLGAVVLGVRWDEVGRDGDTLLLGADDPQAPEVAAALESAFAVAE